MSEHQYKAIKELIFMVWMFCMASFSKLEDNQVMMWVFLVFGVWSYFDYRRADRACDARLPK